jgi:hypothetical protein
LSVRLARKVIALMSARLGPQSQLGFLIPFKHLQLSNQHWWGFNASATQEQQPSLLLVGKFQPTCLHEGDFQLWHSEHLAWSSKRAEPLKLVALPGPLVIEDWCTHQVPGPCKRLTPCAHAPGPALGCIQGSLHKGTRSPTRCPGSPQVDPTGHTNCDSDHGKGTTPSLRPCPPTDLAWELAHGGGSQGGEGQGCWVAEGKHLAVCAHPLGSCLDAIMKKRGGQESRLTGLTISWHPSATQRVQGLFLCSFYR